MQIKKILLALILFQLHVYVFGQAISNVSAIQEQNSIIVSYHLETKLPCKISLYVSLKNGEWKGPLKQVKGNIGDNIKAGENHILWDVLSEFTEFKGSDISFKVETEDMLKKVGDLYQGGIIAFIENGHGLIVSPQDQGNMKWDIAKQYCNNLTLNGYDDWYLPSIIELEILFKNKGMISAHDEFYESDYWSSSEKDKSNAWIVFFYDGGQNYTNKNNNGLIRAVRTF